MTAPSARAPAARSAELWLPTGVTSGHRCLPRQRGQDMALAAGLVRDRLAQVRAYEWARLGLGPTGHAAQGRQHEFVQGSGRAQGIAGQAEDQARVRRGGEEEWLARLHGHAVNAGARADSGDGRRNEIVRAHGHTAAQHDGVCAREPFP